MKIFITGSSGKIGKSISNYLIRKKYNCILNSKKLKGNEKFINYRKDILKNNFSIPDCDVIIHTAAVTPEKNKKKISLNKKIDKKIYSSIKNNDNIKKLIFISTVAVYNNFNKKNVCEKTKIYSNSKYAVLKLNSEKMFLKNKKVRVYNLRIPAILLTGQENNFISNLIEKIRKKKIINMYNPGQLFNNLLIVNSLNVFIENLINKNFKSGNILLGSSKPIRLIKITNLIENFFKVKTKINWKANKRKGFYLNINNAIKNYNFKPIITSKSILNYLKTNYSKNV